MVEKVGNSSKTGKAIRDKKPYPFIAQCALDEGLNDFAEVLSLPANAAQNNLENK